MRLPSSSAAALSIGAFSQRLVGCADSTGIDASRRFPASTFHNRRNEAGLSTMETKYAIATDIALQTGVLRLCDEHQNLFFDDADPAPAFELALELLSARAPRISLFNGDSHELTELIGEVIANSPVSCPGCRAALISTWEMRAESESDTPQPASSDCEPRWRGVAAG